MVKLIYIVVKREDLSVEDFHKYWLETHGPKVRSVAQALKIQKYVQCHITDTPLNAALAQGRSGMPVAELGCGVAELWWNSLDDLMGAFQTEEGQAAAAMLVEDEARFIDFANSRMFMAEEHPVVE